MVANVTNSTKKCPPNIRTTGAHVPVLVSPISVAHRNKMMEAEGGKKTTNWMRDQWVANLKKKRMAQAAAGGASVGPLPNAMPVPTKSTKTTPAKSNEGRPEKPTRSRSRSTKDKNNNNNNNHGNQHNQQLPSMATLSPHLMSGDKDHLSLMSPAMFFNDLGCFEIESQCFTRLTPSTRDNGMMDPMMTATAGVVSNGKDIQNAKKWMKPLMKKRSNCFSLEINEPKRRTPRRLNSSSSGSFDDVDSLSSSSHSFSSVGTPSNFNAEVSRMWGPELDFPTGYVDTFLDLPTPKSAEMPTVSGGSYTPRHSDSTSAGKSGSTSRDLEQPKLIRTTSIEQEGLSHFFEQQTSLGDGQDPATDPTSTRSGKKQPSGYAEDCFGKALPSPAQHHHHLHHHHYLVGNARLQPTPRGLRAANGEYNFDYKNMAEFETLLDEYKLTDIDQDIDSFYLDTFGGEIDLISS